MSETEKKELSEEAISYLIGIAMFLVMVGCFIALVIQNERATELEKINFQEVAAENCVGVGQGRSSMSSAETATKHNAETKSLLRAEVPRG